MDYVVVVYLFYINCRAHNMIKVVCTFIICLYDCVCLTIYTKVRNPTLLCVHS